MAKGIKEFEGEMGGQGRGKMHSEAEQQKYKQGTVFMMKGQRRAREERHHEMAKERRRRHGWKAWMRGQRGTHL
jgi:hypothetical protein